MSRRRGKHARHAPIVAEMSSPSAVATSPAGPLSVRSATTAVVTAIADAVGDLLGAHHDEAPRAEPAE